MDAILALIIYIVTLNVLTFAMMGNDKRKAKKHLWRTPEINFFILSLIGGSLGTLLGMYSFRHKTKKWYFRFGLPILLLIQVGIAIFLVMSPIEFVFI
jgi:uncharacterized membrane protein YsdA (DUF1294 family)